MKQPKEDFGKSGVKVECLLEVEDKNHVIYREVNYATD